MAAIAVAPAAIHARNDARYIACATAPMLHPGAAPLLLIFHAFSVTPFIEMAQPSSTHFVGGMLGVSANVDLCEQRGLASIALSGAVLGGTIRGTATFQDGEGSKLVIHEPLKTALRRRFVSVVSVRLDRATDEVVVVVRLPLLLGTRSLKLVAAPERSKATGCLPLL